MSTTNETAPLLLPSAACSNSSAQYQLNSMTILAASSRPERRQPKITMYSTNAFSAMRAHFRSPAHVNRTR
jgi:hypothetical protein